MTLLKDPILPELALRAAMTMKNIKVGGLAVLVRVNPAQLSNMLSGRALMHRDTIAKICEALEIDLEEFRKRYILHFSTEGHLAERGRRPIDVKALEAYERGQATRG